MKRDLNLSGCSQIEERADNKTSWQIIICYAEEASGMPLNVITDNVISFSVYQSDNIKRLPIIFNLYFDW